MNFLVLGGRLFFGPVHCKKTKTKEGNNLRSKRQKNEQQNDCESNLELYLYLHMAQTIYSYVAYTRHT